MLVTDRLTKAFQMYDVFMLLFAGTLLTDLRKLPLLVERLKRIKDTDLRKPSLYDFLMFDASWLNGILSADRCEAIVIKSVNDFPARWHQIESVDFDGFFKELTQVNMAIVTRYISLQMIKLYSPSVTAYDKNGLKFFDKLKPLPMVPTWDPLPSSQVPSSQVPTPLVININGKSEILFVKRNATNSSVPFQYLESNEGFQLCYYENGTLILPGKTNAFLLITDSGYKHIKGTNGKLNHLYIYIKDNYFLKISSINDGTAWVELESIDMRRHALLDTPVKTPSEMPPKFKPPSHVPGQSTLPLLQPPPQQPPPQQPPPQSFKELKYRGATLRFLNFVHPRSEPLKYYYSISNGKCTCYRGPKHKIHDVALRFQNMYIWKDGTTMQLYVRNGDPFVSTPSNNAYHPLVFFIDRTEMSVGRLVGNDMPNREIIQL